MPNQKISPTALHKIPAELQKDLESSSSLREKWNDITPLARNEWVCWITSAKKAETRDTRLKRTKEDLISGKRRPCCWPGCNHR